MAGISFSGLGSGIDTKSIIEQLMAIEQRPLQKIEQRKSNSEQALSIYSDLRSKLNEFKTLASNMNTIREFRKMSVESPDEDVFTVTAGNNAQAGGHTLKITQLAQAEMEVSQGYAEKTSVVGTGTFSLTVGSEDAVEITLDETNNTLEGMMQAINNSGAEVKATIINDGDASNPYRLVVTSNETGTANAISLDVSALSGGSAPIFTDGSGGTPGQQAKDALMVFDGINVVKSSNEIDDLLYDVTINLKDVDLEKTYDIDIESNLDGIKEDINNFVTKYNEIVDYLKSKGSTSAMKSDYTFSSIKRTITDIVTGGVDNTAGLFSTISSIGITTDTSGHLTVDDEDLTDALEDHFDDTMQLFAAYGQPSSPYIEFLNVGSNTVDGEYDIEVTGTGSGLQALINGEAADVNVDGSLIIGAEGTNADGLMLHFKGSTTGSYGKVQVSLGIMEKLERALSDITSVSTGIIKNKEESINNQIRTYDRQIEQKEENLTKVEARLTARFTKMESMLSQLQNQSNFLSGLG